MSALNAVLGTITFLAITVVFTALTWWLFRIAMKEDGIEENQINDEPVA